MDNPGYYPWSGYYTPQKTSAYPTQGTPTEPPPGSFESVVGKPTFDWKRFLAFFIIAGILCTAVIFIWWFCYIKKPLEVDYTDMTPKPTKSLY